ncbi:hypothetical protein [Chloroflexus sp.]|uniref:hypothetical protein n=1 Tax=Chloroflexus sp. TaxID=1904827 RepID=UPI002ACE50F1|nr:hypothetical protein [Chloroflexus sp.]
MLRRISYYLPSLALRKHRLKIRLRPGYAFWVRGLMDVWVVKETVLDRDYETHGRPI